MAQRRHSTLHEILPPEERAIEAVVARYQRVAPAVTRFARTLAGNDALQVRLGSHASAGPGEIVLDPGVFQTAYARSAPVTPAEVALTTALHEAIHLIATDFDERRPFPEEWAPHIRSALPQQEPGQEAPTFFLLDALSEAGGEAAEALFLSIEDARQEAAYFSGYGGARSVLSDLYRSSIGEALRDAPALGQYALGCFLLVGGYEDRDAVQRRVAPHVAAAVDDAMAFLEPIAHIDDPWSVAGIALQLLEVARIHGLVTEAADGSTRAERRATDRLDQAAINDTVDAMRIVSRPLRDAEGYEDSRQGAQTVSAQQGRKGEAEQAGDPATDQVVRISEAPTVYLPTGQGGKLVVSGFPDRFRRFGGEGRALLEDTAARWGVAQRRVSGELYPLFLANQRRGLRSGYDAGDLSPYAALLLGAGLYDRMFERRDLPLRRSYAVSVLVDGSASMLQPRPGPGARKSPWAMAAATLGAWTLAHLCNELQIEFEVALFNRAFPATADDSERSFSTRRVAATGGLRRRQGGAADRLTRTVNHYVMNSFDARWRSTEEMMAGLFYTAAMPAAAARVARQEPDLAPPVSMFDKASNVDEFNVAYAATRLASRRAATRILVVLADGMTRGSVEALAASVDAVEHAGTTVLGIGIGDTTVQAAYARNQVVEQPDELARAMVDGVRSSLHRTLVTMGGTTWWSAPTELTAAGSRS